MTDTPGEMITAQLNKLVKKQKFGKKTWAQRGLNASSKELCDNLEYELNDILQNLIKRCENSLPDAHDTLKNSLHNFDKYELDTEEMELIADYFSEIASIVKAEINEALNVWLYNFEPGTQDVSKPHQTLSSISIPCQKCANKLSTDIVKERNNVQPFWLIVQCNKCSAFNLLDIPENIDRYKTGDYFVFESINKTAHTLEEAIAKMNFYQSANGQ